MFHLGCLYMLRWHIPRLWLWKEEGIEIGIGRATISIKIVIFAYSVIGVFHQEAVFVVPVVADRGVVVFDSVVRM